MSALDHVLEQARLLAGDPYGALARAAGDGGRSWGYTCLFAPEELLEAAGLQPVRLFAAAHGLHRADRCLTSNCCEFARNLLECFLEGRFDFLAGVLVPHSCDPLQVAMDVARSERDRGFFFFHMPTQLGAAAAPLLVAELERLRAYLRERLGCALDDAALEAACDAADRHDALLRELYALRRERPGVMSGSDATALALAALFMPRAEHARWLEIVLAELRARPYTPPRRFKRRIILSGFVNGSLPFVEMLERGGAIVVDDDLCEGARRLGPAVAPSAPPLERIAARLLGRFCPVKRGGAAERAAALGERYRAAGADGLVLAHFPFCDPQLLDHAANQRRFAESGMNVLQLEVVIGDRNFGQLQTRLEAFLERLRPRRNA